MVPIPVAYYNVAAVISSDTEQDGELAVEIGIDHFVQILAYCRIIAINGIRIIKGVL
ncbi:MAG: hypothetical protein BWY71_01539 [Planctomycetes bacterium ADurb.Bin412]|nr:MAG: hypothetical protein BWY71_01539 [Planctomycetes bacterium ADurb.Bin412]